ncbi:MULTISPECIES: YtxH domain-containing protein [unclassified Exiguobacterium]|uniref:YtxH domain-containing protein n=1 Tax=unclassified Exiguobacterium TaxID=2644629 RepID=UPI00045012A4|nr:MULTISPECIES: YtxH domain-containing protein [unclassified Exiguobacterium]EZP60465.1 Gas vesicle protein [Exiguobacterium sp. RIT341]HAZ39476.1 YtxH domain-containing protein [Exiguobacterium sp.]
MTKQHPYQAQDSSKGGGFLAGIIVGGLIGAAAALLSSPKSGREMRDLIDERTAPARQRLTEQTQVVREKAEPLVGEWIQLAKDKAAPVIEKAKNNSTVQEAAQYAGFEKDQASIDAALAEAEQLVRDIEREIGDEVDGASVAEEIDTETVVDLSELREQLAEEQEEDNDPQSDVNHKK